MSPLDRPRRPLPLLHPPAGLRQRAHGDGAGMPHRRIPPLRSARPHAHGQRLPLGQRRQPPAHPADGLAHASRHPGEPRTTLPSLNAGEGRAFPPDIEWGAAPGPALRRLGDVPGGIRQVARRLQHRASAPSVGPRDADQPLHAEPSELPGDVAADRIWRRRPRPEGGSGRQDQLQRPGVQSGQSATGISGGAPADGDRWRLEGLVHDTSDRGGGLARVGTRGQEAPHV